MTPTTAKKTQLVIYHGNCIDGFAAAWAAWRHFGDGADYLSALHGDKPPKVKGLDVLVVDFAYPRAVMEAMAAEAKSLRVLDHHKTAASDLHDLPFATFDMERSGAGLTWDTLHGGQRPWVIDYVEDRDLWRFKLPDSRTVNAWIGAQRRTFDNLSSLQYCTLDKAHHLGEAVLTYLERYTEDMLAQARIVEFAGFAVPIVNAPFMAISEVLQALAAEQPFAVGWFQRADGVYAYSLRSDENGQDVAEIARRFGGGGHTHSAGFQTIHRLVHRRPPQDE